MEIDKLNIEVEKAYQVLKKGGIILYPTDTIWGIGCDALNQKAIERVYRIKRRDESKNLIILMGDEKELPRYVSKVPSITYDLINNVQTPVTVIYDNAINLPRNLIANDGTIAIRVVKDDFCNQLLAKFGKPIISTSANLAGEPTPLVFSQISDYIKKSVDHVVDLNQEVLNEVKPSTIIRLFENGNYNIVRS